MNDATIQEDAGFEDGVCVVVYRSHKRADTYVYLPAEKEFEELPEAFREHFGEATAFLDFVLHPARQLAQADPLVVLRALSEQGFYLQLPPQKDDF